MISDFEPSIKRPPRGGKGDGTCTVLDLADCPIVGVEGPAPGDCGGSVDALTGLTGKAGPTLGGLKEAAVTSGGFRRTGCWGGAGGG